MREEKRIVSENWKDLYWRIVGDFKEFYKEDLSNVNLIQEKEFFYSCFSDLDTFLTLDKKIFDNLIRFVEKEGKKKGRLKEFYTCPLSSREIQEISEKYGINFYRGERNNATNLEKKDFYLIKLGEKCFPVGIIKYKKGFFSNVISFSKKFPSIKIYFSVYLPSFLKKSRKVYFSGSLSKNKELNLEITLSKKGNLYEARYNFF